MNIEISEEEKKLLLELLNISMIRGADAEKLVELKKKFL